VPLICWDRLANSCRVFTCLAAMVASSNLGMTSCKCRRQAQRENVY
jgi:hypothetical protein